MEYAELVKNKLSLLGKDLLDEVILHASYKEIPSDTEILQEGQFVNYVPILLDGLIKVYTRQEDKELLLYYIQPFESCVMSFIAGLNQEKSKVIAVTGEDCKLLLLPSDKIRSWIHTYPKLNLLYYQQFDMRYNEMIGTINQLLYDKLDKRVLDFMRERVMVTAKNPMKISHREIANELGTAREVVSRIVKKLEREGKLKQYSDSIEVLSLNRLQ